MDTIHDKITQFEDMVDGFLTLSQGSKDRLKEQHRQNIQLGIAQGYKEGKWAYDTHRV